MAVTEGDNVLEAVLFGTLRANVNEVLVRDLIATLLIVKVLYGEGSVGIVTRSPTTKELFAVKVTVVAAARDEELLEIEVIGAVKVPPLLVTDVPVAVLLELLLLTDETFAVLVIPGAVVVVPKVHAH